MTAPAALPTPAAARVLELLEEHLSVRCVKKRWRCICGADLLPFVDNRPLDNRAHRFHLATVIAGDLRRDPYV